MKVLWELSRDRMKLSVFYFHFSFIVTVCKLKETTVRKMSFHSQFVLTNHEPSPLLPVKRGFPSHCHRLIVGFSLYDCWVFASQYNVPRGECFWAKPYPLTWRCLWRKHVASLDSMICDNWTEPQSHMTHRPACVCTLEISWLRSSIEACVVYNLSGSLTVSCDSSISNLYTVQVLECFIDPAEGKKLDLCCSRPEVMDTMTLLSSEHRKLVLVCPLIHRKMFELSVPSWRIKKIKKVFPFTGKQKFLNFPLCAN